MKTILLTIIIILLITTSGFIRVFSEHKEIKHTYVPNMHNVAINKSVPGNIHCNYHLMYDNLIMCSYEELQIVVDGYTGTVDTVYVTPAFPILIGDYIVEHGIPPLYYRFEDDHILVWKNVRIIVDGGKTFSPSTPISRMVYSGISLSSNQRSQLWQGFKNN